MLQGYKTVEQVIIEVKVNVSSFRREVSTGQSIRLNLPSAEGEKKVKSVLVAKHAGSAKVSISQSCQSDKLLKDLNYFV